MSKKSTWRQFYSETLKMKYAYNSETGIVMTEDKVEYTPEEIELLKDSVITLKLHMIKKIFNGKVVTNG